MAHVRDLGNRIELVSMDPHFHDISISLYERRGGDGQAAFLVHTYSQKADAESRVDFVVRAMAVLGGMAVSPKGAHTLEFPCGAEHRLACKRIFLEACKLDPSSEPEARPLSVFDKKSELTIYATGTDDGRYQLSAEGDGERKERRVAAVGGGLMKLAQMRAESEDQDRVLFECGEAHDQIIGLLLGRALNVRASMREQEAAAARGVLAAPSAQGSGPTSF